MATMNPIHSEASDTTVLAAVSSTAVPAKPQSTKLFTATHWLLKHRLAVGFVLLAAVVGVALGVGLGVGLRDQDTNPADMTTVAASSFNIQLRLEGATCSQQYLQSATLALKQSLQAKPGVVADSVVVNVDKCTDVQGASTARRMLAVTSAYMDMATSFIITDLASAQQMQEQINSLASNPNAAASDVCGALPGLCTSLQAQGLTTTFGTMSMSYEQKLVPTSSLPSPPPSASAPSPAAAPSVPAAKPQVKHPFHAEDDELDMTVPTFYPTFDPIAYPNLESGFFDD